MTQEQIIDVLNEAQTEFKGINEANIHSADILITMFEKQKLEFAIEQLKEVDFNMCKLLRQESINFDLSQEEATYKWRRTKWHLEIISKIKELEQKLSELNQ